MKRDLPIEVELLRQILATLQSIERKLDRSSNATDPLLQSLHDTIGVGVAFSSVELTERAPETFGADPNALGRKLSRLRGRGVRDVGKDENGVVWTLG